MSSKPIVHADSRWMNTDWSSLSRKPLSADSGRGALHLIEHPLGVILERTYRHGGIRRLILADYFKANNRPAHEFAIHKKAHLAGIATPEPVGWGEIHSMPGIRRYFYYSRYLEGTRPLPQCLNSDIAVESYLWQIALILWQLYNEDIYHHDLNLNNWLADPKGKVYLIDFDKAQRGDPDRVRYLTRCLRRMVRSARRLGLSHRRSLFFRLTILCARQFDVDVRQVLAGIPTGEQNRRWYHRLVWKISGGHYHLN